MVFYITAIAFQIEVNGQFYNRQVGTQTGQTYMKTYLIKRDIINKITINRLLVVRNGSPK